MIQPPAAGVWALGNRTWIKNEGRAQPGNQGGRREASREKSGLGEMLMNRARGTSGVS